MVNLGPQIILKYNIPLELSHSDAFISKISVPMGSTIISVEIYRERLSFWVKARNTDKKSNKYFKIFKNNNEISFNPYNRVTFWGTKSIPSKNIDLHVYEITNVYDEKLLIDQMNKNK